MKILFYICVLSTFSFSQIQWYNHSELNWHEMETEHFIICFHDETERSAREAALVAEEVYHEITTLYDFEPSSKTRIIIKDVDDYSNGSAYFYDNKIIIWAKPLDYDLRGSHRWIQDVVTHEFTHIVQLGASMKYSRNVPGMYLQVLSYEEEKREDVLYGFPNEIISYPIPGTSVPPWFAEGTAQYMYEGANYDHWDSIRDMILRDRLLNDNLLSLDEMNTFGKKGIGNESAYNQGYSLTKYIVKVYGEDVLKDISDNLSKASVYSINKAIYNCIGINAYELYNNWISHLSKVYKLQLENIVDKNTYNIIAGENTTNIHPVWSPNGKKIAYLSNSDNDYFTQTDLYIYNTLDLKEEKIKGGVKTAPVWINDSLIVYSKISKPDKNGSKFFDLYSFDLNEKKENRLSHGLRLYSPVFNRKNKKIYAITTFDGTSNIIESDLEFKNYKSLTDFNDGMQIFSLAVKDSSIIFDAVTNHGRKIYNINIYSKSLNLLKNNEWDDRDPVFYNDNLYFVNDKKGIFNLSVDNGEEVNYLSNVKGGVFMPDISNDGKIVCSIYDKGSYKVAILDTALVIDESIVGYSNYTDSRSDFNEYEDQEIQYYYKPISNQIKFLKGESRKYKPYKAKMAGPFILPRITYDYSTVKTGFYFFDGDYINKLSVLGGLSYNADKDLDFFLLFDNNEYKNSYFFNFYWMSRNISKAHPYIDATGQVIPSINYHVDYSYQLFSTDMGSRFIIKDHKFWLKYTYSKYRQFYDVRQIQEYEFNELNTNVLYGKGAYDYYRGHIISFEYEYEGRKPHYLYKMIPKSGFKINSSISYENNSLFEEFKVNEDYGGFIEDLQKHNTLRYKLDISNYWEFKSLKKYQLVLATNFKYFHLSNDNADDFLYFFGGGLPGLKAYTFYEPTLQGPRQFIMSNTLSTPIFKEKSIKIGHLYLNSLSLGLTYQLGRSFNGKIMVSNMGYNINEIDNNGFLYEFQNIPVSGTEYGSLQDYLDLNASIDALDKNNIINDNIEPFLYPDIYAEFNDNNFQQDSKNIEDLKRRYNSLKYSVGLELKLLGFSFYSYPTALTYEYYIPVSDPWNSLGKQYLRILFDFN